MLAPTSAFRDTLQRLTEAFTGMEKRQGAIESYIVSNQKAQDIQLKVSEETNKLLNQLALLVQKVNDEVLAERKSHEEKP